MILNDSVRLEGPFEAVLARVKQALQSRGFGTLTEIDVRQTLAEKVGKEMGDYVIVGACNPHLASRAIDLQPQIGVLLPCNVVVRAGGGDTVLVEAMDPGVMSELVDADGIVAVADEARTLIAEALAQLD